MVSTSPRCSLKHLSESLGSSTATKSAVDHIRGGSARRSPCRRSTPISCRFPLRSPDRRSTDQDQAATCGEDAQELVVAPGQAAAHDEALRMLNEFGAKRVCTPGVMKIGVDNQPAWKRIAARLREPRPPEAWKLEPGRRAPSVGPDGGSPPARRSLDRTLNDVSPTRCRDEPAGGGSA